MNPADVILAAAWVGSAGGVCCVVVQLVKAFLGVDSPREKVGTAALASFVLVLSFAVQSGISIPGHPFDLIVAVVTIAATGAGLQSAITATVTGKPQGPV